MSSELTSNRVFVALIILSLLLVGTIIFPFGEALFLACVLAAVFSPVQERLARRFRGRRAIAAALITFLVIIALLLPVSGFAAYLAAEFARWVQFVTETFQSEGVTGLVDTLPQPLRGLAERFAASFPALQEQSQQRLQQQLGAQGTKAAAAVGGVVAATGSAIVQLVMMLIAFFFLLLDGRGLVRWLEKVSPLKRGETTEILVEFRNVSVAVVVSSLATAGVQALAALAGYLIAGVPQPVIFAVITFILAFIPTVGAGGVVFAAALLQFVTGHPWGALFLVIWGALVVGLVDNALKPFLIKRGMELHGAVVFFALLGGLATFGAVGLIAGPLIVAFFLTLLRIHERDFVRRPPGMPASTSSTGGHHDVSLGSPAVDRTDA